VPGEERVALFAFMPLGPRHLVVMASVPQSALPVLGPQIEATLSTLKYDGRRPTGGVARASWGAALGVMLGGGLLLARAWRRRKTRRTAASLS
jgi:hypothetical protein